jgi:hypothetical protein
MKGFYTTSVSLLINNQLQAGLGPGYILIEKKKAVLLVSEGATTATTLSGTPFTCYIIGSYKTGTFVTVRGLCKIHFPDGAIIISG